MPANDKASEKAARTRASVTEQEALAIRKAGPAISKSFHQADGDAARPFAQHRDVMAVEKMLPVD